MKILLIAMAMVCSSFTLGHSMQPSSQVVQAIGKYHEEAYTIRNDYPFPAVFEIFVWEKDRTESSDWRTIKKIYKLLPNSERRVIITFKATEQKKLLVCSRLIGVGKDEKQTDIRSTICSRLIVNSAS